MPPRRARIPALVALLVASCAPPATAPVLDLSPLPAGSAPSPAVSEACERAAQRRAGARKLLADGRLERALRALTRADDLCPASAAESEADRRAALAELGAPPPAGGGDALYEAGLAARRAGHEVEARRLFDRAVAALERTARAAGDRSARVVLDVPNGIADSVVGAAWGALDGAAYLAVAHEKSVTIFDATTWYEQRVLPHPEAVTELAASPDGKSLATGSYDALRIWDVADGKERVRREGAHGHVAWSADGKVLVTGEGRSIEIWRSGGTAPARVIEIPVPAGHKEPDLHVECVAVSRGGDSVVAGRHDGSLGAFRGGDGKALWSVPAHKGRVMGVAVSPDGKRVATAGGDGVKLWDAARGKAGRQLSKRHTSTVAFDPGGATVVAPSMGRLQAWSAATGAETVHGDGTAPRSLAFDAGGKRIAGTSLGKVLVWDAESGKELHRIEPHAEAIQAAAWMPGGDTFVTGGWDGSVRLWDTRSGAPLRTITGEQSVVSLAVSPDGALIAAGNTDAKTVIWTAATGQAAHTFEGKTAWNSAAAFSRSGKLLAVGADKAVVLLEVGSWRELRTFGPAADEITSLAFSPDDRVLAGGGRDSDVRLWETSSGLELGRLSVGNAVSGLAFRGDGTTLLAGANEGLVLIPTGGPRLLRELEGHAGYVSAIGFGPGDTRVVSGSSDHHIRVFDPDSGHLIRDLDVHTATVNAVAYRPDGKWLLSGSDDGSIRLSSAEGAASLVIRAVTHTPDAYAFTPGAEGRIQFFGDAGRAFAVCRIGKATYRFDLCRERVEEPGLFARMLGGDPAADP